MGALSDRVETRGKRAHSAKRILAPVHWSTIVYHLSVILPSDLQSSEHLRHIFLRHMRSLRGFRLSIRPCLCPFRQCYRLVLLSVYSHPNLRHNLHSFALHFLAILGCFECPDTTSVLMCGVLGRYTRRIKEENTTMTSSFCLILACARKPARQRTESIPEQSHQ